MCESETSQRGLYNTRRDPDDPCVCVCARILHPSVGWLSLLKVHVGKVMQTMQSICFSYA